ncbi:MAG: hypothetical protein ACO1OQ_05195 [Rufibacter sp.]
MPALPMLDDLADGSYMKNLSSLCLLALGLFAFQCARTPEVPDAVYGQTWLYSYEEDSADVRTYRPNTFSFPPSRGRTGFMVQKNGTFVRYGIAPTDGLEEQPGAWKAQGKNLLNITYSDPKHEPEQIEIVQAAPTVLKIRRKTTAEQ